MQATIGKTLPEPRSLPVSKFYPNSHGEQSTTSKTTFLLTQLAAPSNTFAVTVT
jgi:hypothetical protein